MDTLPPALRAMGAMRRARRRERARVSQALHDTVGQALTAVGLELDLIGLDFGAANLALAARVAAVQRTLDGAFQSVRALARDTHPAPAARFGLGHALERLVERARGASQAAIEAELDGTAAPGEAVAEAFYECIAEALGNAIEHAGAARIRVALHRAPGALVAEVSDDGRGFERAEVVPGVGFLTYEYHEALGLVYVKLETNVGQGTGVTLISPDRD